MTEIIKLFSVLLVAEVDEKTAYIITLTGSNADVLEACKNPATGKIKAHRR